MNEVLKTLVDIQSLEEDIQKLTREKKNLPNEISELESLIARLKHESEIAAQDFKKEEVKLRELEVDLREIQEKIRSFQEKARQVKSNEEFRAMQAQIEHADMEKRKKEEEIISQMELVEAMKTQLPKRLESIEKELNEKLRELEEKKQLLDTISKELEEKRSLREVFISKLPEKERQLFEKLYSRSGPIVLSKVIKISVSKNEVEYSCSGCNSIIPLSFVQELKVKGGYSRCPNCGRIIYYHEEV